MSTDPDPFAPTGGEFKATKTPGGPLSPEDLITLNEEIASMARAGLPLDQGLSVLAREMGRGKLKNVTAQLANDLRAGFSLPDALKRQEGRLPPYYSALLAAGIRSGRIGDVLGTLTLYSRSVADFREAVTSALLYPAVVLILGFGLFVFIGYTIIPKYVEIFREFKMKLPFMTEVLVFIMEHPLEFYVMPPVLVILGVALERWWLRRTAWGRIAWARWVNAVPIIGTMIRAARLAAFADLLGILVDQSVPLPEALRLAAEASSDPLLTEGARRVEAQLQQGAPLAKALTRERLVPGLVVWMIGFGERQGTLGATLHQLALMYRRQAEVRAAFLRTILPPLLIVLLALTLGGMFIFGLTAPLFELLDGLSGGGKK